jgi:acetoin utilization deacetylase AcuC-like enzyme
MADSLPPDGPVRLTPRAATPEEIMTVHSSRHFDLVAESSGKSGYAFDPDTYASAGSFQASLISAGGLLTVSEAIMRGEIDNGFALVRPPGHHAERDRAMGFCLFNNIAIAARVLLDSSDIERVLIVDWDVHHGNGTQNIFYEDPRVLYASLHRYPFYPGSGAVRETGSGRGAGYTVNIPLPAGSGDSEFIQAGREIIKPIAEQFEPDFVLVSAGFDAHRRDPLGGLNVTEAGYAQLTRILMDVAAGSADGRLALVLEGGYDLAALRSCVEAVLEVMAGKDTWDQPEINGSDLFKPETVMQVLREYWQL